MVAVRFWNHICPQYPKMTETMMKPTTAEVEATDSEWGPCDTSGVMRVSSGGRCGWVLEVVMGAGASYAPRPRVQLWRDIVRHVYETRLS